MKRLDRLKAYLVHKPKTDQPEAAWVAPHCSEGWLCTEHQSYFYGRHRCVWADFIEILKSIRKHYFESLSGLYSNVVGAL